MHKEMRLCSAGSLKVCECRTKVVRDAAVAHQLAADFLLAVGLRQLEHHAGQTRPLEPKRPEHPTGEFDALGVEKVDR